MVIERVTQDWWVDGHCVEAVSADEAREAVELLHDVTLTDDDVKPWPASNAGAPYLDVWLRIPDGEEESEAEANTRREDDGYRVDWYLTAVGWVRQSPWFADYADARAWLEAEGFADFTVHG